MIFIPLCVILFKIYFHEIRFTRKTWFKFTVVLIDKTLEETSMRKNFLAIVALAVASFFVATEIARAADITFGGQLRHRYEINEQSDFDDRTEASDFMSSRIRLNADVNINDSTSAFIQMQSVSTWGSDTNSFNPNHTRGGNVLIHQAYFTLKNFANLPVPIDLKAGRQEIILDGHRLFGNTNWTQGAQTHDALRLTHAHDNIHLTYAWIIANEHGALAHQIDASGNTRAFDQGDNEVHMAYASYTGILGGKLSITYAFIDDRCGARVDGSNLFNTTACQGQGNAFHTIGGRQAGQLFGIDYRGEYYYQFGDGHADFGATQGTGNRETDREAYMFGARIGKTFKNVPMKPGLTFWYDYLSGTSTEDRADNKFGAFNTLFDTGHKFYGYMDQYLNIGSSDSDVVNGHGLRNVAVKAKLSPMPGWTLKADYHWFWTAEKADNNARDLGNELDVTLVNKYNANTNITIGYSNYSKSSERREITAIAGGARTGDLTIGPDDANWAYVMFDVKF